MRLSLFVTASVTLLLVAISACNAFNGSSGASGLSDAGSNDDASTSPDASTTGGDGAIEASTGSDGASGVVTVLSIEGPNAQIRALAIDPSGLYWIDNNFGQIRRLRAGAVMAETLITTTHAPSALIVGDGRYAWSDVGQGTLSIVTEANPTVVETPVTLDDSGTGNMGAASLAYEPQSKAIWWTDFGGDVAHAPIEKPDNAETIEESGQTNPFRIVSDGTDLYWTESGGNHRVWRWVAGAGATPIAGSESDCQSIAAFNGAVYWARPSASTVRTWSAGTGPTDVSTTEKTPRSLAADISGVYWMLADGSVRHWIAGMSAPETLYAGDGTQSMFDHARSIALDDNYVYFARESDSAIVRLTKVR